jgi:hypothetical protein
MPAVSAIDAVIVPAGYAAASTLYWEMAQLAVEFAPLLGVARLHKKSLLDGRDFLPRHLEDTLLYPVGHPREGQARYHWQERESKDGVQYGTLKNECE